MHAYVSGGAWLWGLETLENELHVATRDDHEALRAGAQCYGLGVKWPP